MKRGFSLIETMIASSMLMLVAAALLTTMSYAAAESARTRMKTLASTDAHAQIERIVGIVQVASTSSMTQAQLCSLLTAANGPLTTAGGGTLSGTCPALTLVGHSVQGTALRRKTQLFNEPLGAVPGLRVVITITGPQLLGDIVFQTHVRQ